MDIVEAVNSVLNETETALEAYSANHNMAMVTYLRTELRQILINLSLGLSITHSYGHLLVMDNPDNPHNGEWTTCSIQPFESEQDLILTAKKLRLKAFL